MDKNRGRMGARGEKRRSGVLCNTNWPMPRGLNSVYSSDTTELTQDRFSFSSPVLFLSHDYKLIVWDWREKFITWCKQHMSALDTEHMEGTEVSDSPLPRSIARHHSCFHWSLEYTLGLCQRRWNRVASCDYNIQSSGSHDTPRSIQKDSHSVQASSALNHVTWRSRQHKAPRDHEDFVWKDTHYKNWPHIQHRTHIPRLDCHRYTCRTLDCVEDKGSLLHHLGDRTIHLPLNLRMTNYKFAKVHHSPIKWTHNKFHFFSNWQYNRAN